MEHLGRSGLTWLAINLFSMAFTLQDMNRRGRKDGKGKGEKKKSYKIVWQWLKAMAEVIPALGPNLHFLSPTPPMATIGKGLGVCLSVCQSLIYHLAISP